MKKSLSIFVLLSALSLASASSVFAQNKKPETQKVSGGKDEKADKSPLKGLFTETPSAGSGPLFIKSDSLELNSKERVFVYKGRVEIVRDDVTITAKLVEGRYNKDNKLETILCKQNVVITQGEAMKATADRAVYNVAKATVELTEGPEVIKEGNALAADKITLFLNEDRSEAEGNVRMKVIKPSEGESK